MKQLLLIRHGQAEHNALFARDQYPEAQALQDAPLNAKGAKQVQMILNIFPCVLQPYFLVYENLIPNIHPNVHPHLPRRVT